MDDTQPPMDDTQPPMDGTHPPMDGTHPPTGGTDPEAVPPAAFAPAPDLPYNLLFPLDGDVTSPRGPLLPTSRARPPARASYWELLLVPIVLFACMLFMLWAGPPFAFSVPEDLAAALARADDRIVVPPLEDGLWRRCIDLLPAPKGLYAGRLERLAAELGESAVWVAEPGASVEYFLGGFGVGSWSQSERPFLVAVTTGGKGPEVTILTPRFEEGRARQRELGVRVSWLAWAESESPYTVLMHALGERTLVLDGAVRSFIADGLRGTGHTTDADAKVLAGVRALREIKDEREIELMRCANKFTLHAIRKTRARMHMGISESATRTILYEEMKYLGLQDYGALILFGENAALPHGSGTDRFLQPADLVLIDAGGRWGSYVSDITRTFALPDSTISGEHREVWEIVRWAQLAPASLLRLLDVSDRPQYAWLDDRARETIKKAMAAYGVPPARGHAPDYTVFTHRLGHGIGLEGHESPYAVQGALGDRLVLPGHTLTFEPGVYIPAGSSVGDEAVRGLGVRLEDVVVVRADEERRMRAEWLTGPVEKWGDV